MNRRRMVVCPRRSVVRVSRATAVSVNGRRSITVERAPARSHSRSAQPDRPATARRSRTAAQSHQSQRAAPPAASQSVDRHLPDTARADHHLPNHQPQQSAHGPGLDRHHDSRDADRWEGNTNDHLARPTESSPTWNGKHQAIVSVASQRRSGQASPVVMDRSGVDGKSFQALTARSDAAGAGVIAPRAGVVREKV